MDAKFFIILLLFISCISCKRRKTRNKNVKRNNYEDIYTSDILSSIGDATDESNNTVPVFSKWILTPKNAVLAGQDVDGDDIFIGRTKYNNDMLPAAIIPHKLTAMVSWGGNEIIVRNAEFLVTQESNWKFAYDGGVPENAVLLGKASNGEQLYIARFYPDVGNSICVGKLQPSHLRAYCPFRGKEIHSVLYEVLVFNKPATTNSKFSIKNNNNLNMFKNNEYVNGMQLPQLGSPEVLKNYSSPYEQFLKKPKQKKTLGSPDYYVPAGLRSRRWSEMDINE